ncbi:hypothetical protein [Leptolyngbya sp. FACHB-16]|uniref:hypothetical protein n=1 Tax=unclassified Leptolyngbya TaxID=2650499 RepID=UPI0016847AE3|nr:hypothetical protein [Leptolyngbya sp. FACHB-16]MBD2153135.1 hypothetical protein [Leptolyngbya sp. FACHB-16]
MDSERFYDPDGLKEIARLIDAHLEDRRISQNEFASFAGVASNTIGALRKHRKNRPGEMIGSKPDPDTILAIARQLIEPATGKPFEPWDLILLATGRLRSLTQTTDPENIDKEPGFRKASLDTQKVGKVADEVDTKPYDSTKRIKDQGSVKVVAHKNRKAARILLKALGDRTLVQASEVTGIPEERMQDLLEGSEPTFKEYGRLTRLFKGDGAADYLEAFGSNLD